LIGDATKAKEKLGWVHETKWADLCAEMVQADLVAVAKEERRNA
jgi:GDPmannose 4,6-dehydratase